jgi:hypothetical protein
MNQQKLYRNVMCSFRLRIVHDIDINDYQVARSRRADDEIVSCL